MNKEEIIKTCTRVFANRGYDGLSMRTFAKEMGCSFSALYYYYPSKDDLLLEMFNMVNAQLGLERKKLPTEATVERMLRQRILFQFEYAEEVVAILKYYMHYRPHFLKNDYGFLPIKAHFHIQEVLQEAVDNNQLQIENIEKEAKLITHMINGYVLEYYPDMPNEQETLSLAKDITHFVLRSFHLVS